MRRSMGDDTFDMGPGAKICIAAANGSTVGTATASGDSVAVDSGVAGSTVSVTEGIGSGVDEGDAVGDAISVGIGIVASVGITITESGEGEGVPTIQGGGGTCDGVVPHPTRAADPISTTRKMT